MMGVATTLNALELVLVLSFVAGALGGCEFNSTWSGRWFQSGIRHLVNINSTTIETKGTCVERSGDKFIMEDKSESVSCFRCMFITANHDNVLQYKETYCMESYDGVDALCNMISGDAALYLLFRDEPIRGHSAEACPFKGAPFTFTYNRGTGECQSPVSRIDSCIQDSRLRVHYQACPDIPGTESAVEELVCMARWKEGSQRYMIGKISRKITTSDEDRYRCFVYEKTTSADGRVGYNVAQSGDATCSGLQSASEGSKTMKLTKVDMEHTRCHYPKFVTDHHVWHALDYSLTYHFTQRNATLRETEGSKETRVTCHNIEYNGEGVVRLVAHATEQCNSGYLCIVFYKRDAHVIELQQSNVTVQVPEEACSPDNFQPNHVAYTTLITTAMKPRKCPHLGRYSVRSALPALVRADPSRDRTEAEGPEAECEVRQYKQLVVGCNTADLMEFTTQCQSKPVVYSCHAGWEQNGTSYVIASPVSRASVGARRLCIEYSSDRRDDSDVDATINTLASYTSSCHRATDNTELFRFNLTVSGHCELASTSAVSTSTLFLPSLLFIVVVLVALAHAR